MPNARSSVAVGFTAFPYYFSEPKAELRVDIHRDNIGTDPSFGLETTAGSFALGES